MILFIIAYILLLPLSLLNYIVVAFRGKSSGYFRSTAVNMDKFGNREFRSLFNATLRTDAGYRFGDVRETISSVLGKNQRDGTLSKVGKILVAFLDFIDKNHCEKSIENFE